MCKVHVRYKNISWPILLWSCPVNLFLIVKPRFSPALCCLKCPLQWGSSKRQPPQQGHLSVQFSSLTQSCPTLWPHEAQYTRPPCPSPTRRVYSNSCPSSRWCHPAISSSCRPLLLLPPIPPSIRVFSNESTLRMRWPKYWSFSFSISPSNEHPGLISFRMDWLDLLLYRGSIGELPDNSLTLKGTRHYSTLNS